MHKRERARERELRGEHSIIAEKYDRARAYLRPRSSKNSRIVGETSASITVEMMAVSLVTGGCPMYCSNLLG